MVNLLSVLIVDSVSYARKKSCSTLSDTCQHQYTTATPRLTRPTRATQTTDKMRVVAVFLSLLVGTAAFSRSTTSMRYGEPPATTMTNRHHHHSTTPQPRRCTTHYEIDSKLRPPPPTANRRRHRHHHVIHSLHLAWRSRAPRGHGCSVQLDVVTR